MRALARKKTPSPSAKLPTAKGSKVSSLVYSSVLGVDAYVSRVKRATPLQIIELERAGMQGAFIKDLSARMNVPVSRMYGILGISKATGERKAAANTLVAGSGGQAAVAMAKLIGIAQEIVADSTVEEAEAFDTATWLGRWIERPQPSLGGRRPAELLDTPTGFDVVARLLGAISSGSYQ